MNSEEGPIVRRSFDGGTVIVLADDMDRARAVAKEVQSAGGVPVTLSRDVDAIGYLNEHAAAVAALVISTPTASPGRRALMETVRQVYPKVRIVLYPALPPEAS